MMNQSQNEILPSRFGWRKKLYEIIFEADTPLGIAFDVLLLIAILASVFFVCLETTYSHNDPADLQRIAQLDKIELLITIVFSIEYVLRIICVRNPWRYVFSFFGIIDLLACLPGFLFLATDRYSSMSVIRLFRIIRVFRLFKLGWFVSESEDLGRAVWKARAKIIVFLTIVLITVTITGALMYEMEHQENGEQFSSIPQSIYWAIVTMTTVGYGDIVPKTVPGKFISAALIVIGYSLIIVPTGFVSAELSGKARPNVTNRVCDHCFAEGHAQNAQFCNRCGTPMA